MVNAGVLTQLIELKSIVILIRSSLKGVYLTYRVINAKYALVLSINDADHM
jgi:hypothetical protein